MLERFMTEQEGAGGESDKAAATMMRPERPSASGANQTKTLNGTTVDQDVSNPRMAWRRSEKAVKAVARIAQMSRGGGNGGGKYTTVSGNETAPPTEAPNRWVSNEKLADITELEDIEVHHRKTNGGGGKAGSNPYATPLETVPQEYPESEYDPTHETGIHERL